MALPLTSRIKQGGTKPEKRVTTVKSNTRVTTGTGPTPIRLTPNDKSEMADWLDELEALTPKKLSPAKLVRGLIAMRKDIPADKLIEAIKNIS